nr:MAG TPA: hypothetical protein [Caudoviricetes sp.]
MTLAALKKLLLMTATHCTFIFLVAQWSHEPGQTVPGLKAGHRK